jgi:hypothetical protein
LWRYSPYLSQIFDIVDLIKLRFRRLEEFHRRGVAFTG